MTDVAHAINEYKRRKDLGKASLIPNEYSVFKVKAPLRARLHQVLASTLRQLCDDAPDWGYNPFSSISIDFNENRIASIIAELPQC